MWLKTFIVLLLLYFWCWPAWAGSELVIKLMLQESLLTACSNDLADISNSTQIISESTVSLDQRMINLDEISKKLDEYIQKRLNDYQQRLAKQEEKYQLLDKNYSEVQKQNDGLNLDLVKYKKSTESYLTSTVIVSVTAGLIIAVETFIIIKDNFFK